MSEVEVIEIDIDETLFDFKDGNGLVAAHRHPKGKGWVANTAKVDEDCFIGEDARVYGNAVVSGNARVYDKARVYGDATITNSARVSGNSKVYGNAVVCNNAMIYGDAEVYEDAKVRNHSQVYGSAIVCGDADLSGNIKINSNNIVTRRAVAILGFDVDIVITDHHITLGEYAIPPSQITNIEGVDEEWAKLLSKVAEFHGCIDNDK
jgi:predicted acyltransferase (DUF342 family)